MNLRIAGIGLLAITVAAPARADWQYAKWGATAQEVIAASGGKAQPTPSTAGGSYRDGRVQLVSGTHTAGSRTFDVKFLFRDARLSDVQLTFKSAAPADCNGLETDLTALYGEPLSRSNGSGGDILSRKWADKANNNQIAFLNVTYSTSGCYLTYSPIQSAETNGL